MKQFLTRVLLAAMVGGAGLSVAPVAALADGIYFGFDNGPGYGNRPRRRRRHHRGVSTMSRAIAARRRRPVMAAASARLSAAPGAWVLKIRKSFALRRAA